MSTQNPPDTTEEQTPAPEAGEVDNEGRLYRTVGPAMSRRNILRAGAAAAGTAALPLGAKQLGYEPVGTAQAVAPVAAYWGGIVVATAAGAVYHWYTADDLPDREDATLSQTHRDVHAIARGLDSSSDKEQDFENLVAQNAHHAIWSEALYDFAIDYNEALDKSLATLKDEFRQRIRDEYAEREKQILQNWNTDMRQLAEMLARIQDYGYEADLDQMLRVYVVTDDGPYSYSREHYNYATFADTRWSTPSSDHGLTAMVDPYSEENGGTISQEDLVERDYELINWEVETAVDFWHSDFSWFQFDQINEGGWLNLENGEAVQFDGADVDRIEHVVAQPPDDADGEYYFLHPERRMSALDTIRTEAKNLASEVDAYVDGIAATYPRGELPVMDVVPPSQLHEEFGYEEGDAGLSALYLSQLGLNTDLRGTVTVTNYGDTYDPSTDEGDGTELTGYLATAADETFETGEVYDGADYNEDILLVTDAGVNKLTRYFRVEEIRSYEGGEVVKKSSFTPESYNFQSRDPDLYEEDIKSNRDARQDAIENEEITKAGIGGGIGGSAGTALLILGGLAAAILGLSGEDGKGGVNVNLRDR
ncbi:hypothetical protein [Halopiger djelfimassiliensis]|uniref:hypothetical protein n=1 Tax=Halopiger djelfimassiliensis TaxID=1293047 RepID=UPI00067832A5|nr:hypothetical protein [Halopiger djelfimassiliensis]